MNHKIQKAQSANKVSHATAPRHAFGSSALTSTLDRFGGPRRGHLSYAQELRFPDILAVFEAQDRKEEFGSRRTRKLRLL
jgi:hypothetical protein